MNRVVIAGAASAIAEATARIFAARGDSLYLVARDWDRLGAIAADLTIRGATAVGYERLDLRDMTAHEAMLGRATAFLGEIDTVLIAHGTLGDQLACQNSVDLTMAELTTNALSVVALATQVASRMAARNHGTLAVISSVAGDRGRQSNYVYGSAKAMVTTFLSGLRQRMHKHGVQVITVKPGFVDSPMTAAFRKGMLWAKPATVATRIVNAIDRRRNVVYAPSFWRPVMLAVRMLPEPLFKRMTL